MFKRLAILIMALVMTLGTGIAVGQSIPNGTNITVDHYEVQPGDSWSVIARTLAPGVTGQARIDLALRIAVANGGNFSTVLIPGRILMYTEEMLEGPVVTTTSTTTTTTTRPPTTTTRPPTTTTTRPPTTTTSTSTTTIPPHHGGDLTYVDRNALPPAQAGQNGVQLVNASYGPRPDPWVGAFRTDCTFSHMNFDDPIVYPGQQNATHLHAFYGNTQANYQMTTADNGATSTCSGAGANRTAYWFPAMIDTTDGSPVVSDYVQIYYKTGYNHPTQTDVEVFPAGLRMIAGQAVGSLTADSSGRTYFYCNSEGSGGSVRYDHIPDCPPGDILVMAVWFPQCWDGVNLDSPDHRSHMAYPILPRGGCPTTHPVALPEIIEHIWYEVGPEGTSSWRLSSDRTDRPGGYSAHADWWNGWDRGILNRINENCWQVFMDCQMNLVGGGQQLRWIP